MKKKNGQDSHVGKKQKFAFWKVFENPMVLFWNEY